MLGLTARWSAVRGGRGLVQALKPLLWTTGGTVAAEFLVALSGIIVARALGPEGKGVVTAVITWAQILGVIALLGMGVSQGVRLAAEGEAVLPVLLGNAVVYSVTAGGVVLGGALIVVPPLLAPLGSRAGFLSAVALIQIPAAIFGAIAVALVLSLGHVRQYNLCRMAGPFVALIVASSLWGAGLLTAGWAVFASIVGAYTSVVLAAWRLPWSQIKVNRKILSADLRFGAKVWLWTVMRLTNHRLDLLVMSLILPGVQLGLYGVANNVMLAVLIIPTAAATLLGVSIARLEREQADRDFVHARQIERIRRSALRYGGLAACMGIVLVLVARPVIVGVFGPDFGGATVLVQLLVPGYVARAYAAVAIGGAVGMRRAWVGNLAEGAGMAVTLVLLPVLLPAYGAVGAAITSTCAYGVSAGVAAFALHRVLPSRPALGAADAAGDPDAVGPESSTGGPHDAMPVV